MHIHYFQRYHSKENVVTSNTMLMLARLYNYNADKFFTMINALILGEDETPEITFNLQVAGDDSVPDAVISQKSFKIVVETKLYNQYGLDQLTNHLKQFADEEIKVLLTIDPKPMKNKMLEDLAIKLANYNTGRLAELKTPVKHTNLTFEQLIKAMEDIVDDRDTEIIAVLDDFKAYCFDERLISDREKWMRAVTAGRTLRDNIELNLYYDDAAHSFSDHGYIGLYSNKSIRAVGRLEKTVVVNPGDESPYNTETGEALTDFESDNIRSAMKRAKENGYSLDDVPHRFFLVDKFYAMDFRKASKNPIQKSKFFNLGEMLGYEKMPDTAEIAKDLNGKTWEELT